MSIRGVMSPELVDAINEMCPEVQEIVDHVQSKPPMSKGYYQEYMSVLARFQKETNSVAKTQLIALALIKCGGDSFGISWALNIMGLTSGTAKPLR